MCQTEAYILHEVIPEILYDPITCISLYQESNNLANKHVKMARLEDYRSYYPDNAFTLITK